MSFISSIFSGLGAGQAASQEVQGAQAAQQEEQQNQQNAINAQNTSLANINEAENPYTTLGGLSAGNLTSLLAKGFQAPTLAQAEATPGYQFELNSGTNAIDANGAANGTLMSGTTGTALENYGQGLASTTYEQAYKNALDQYMTNYSTLMGGTQIGQGATNTIANANLNTANQTGNIDLTAAQQQAQQLNNAAAARAQGTMGEYGAMGSGFSSLAGFAMGGGFGNLINSFSGGGGGAPSSGGFADPNNFDANVANL